MKIVNSDDIYEKMLNDNGLDTTQGYFQTKDKIGSHENEKWYVVTS